MATNNTAGGLDNPIVLVPTPFLDLLLDVPEPPGFKREPSAIRDDDDDNLPLNMLLLKHGGGGAGPVGRAHFAGDHDSDNDCPVVCRSWLQPWPPSCCRCRVIVDPAADFGTCCALD
jgi:hypothetical protein